VVHENKVTEYKRETGTQNPSSVSCGFSFSYILHRICFKIHFTE